MKITMLGTGNAMVTECYNTCYVISDGDWHFMVDGGGGNVLLRRLQQAGIDWAEIRDIFVTHKHVDHILGIVWLMRLICQAMDHGDYIGEARIYGHEEVISILKTLAEMLLDSRPARFVGNRLRFITVEDGECREILGRRVQFFDIQSKKAKQFGYTMQLDGGGKLACCGDEPCSACGEPYVSGADWLLHEAFCLYAEREIFEPYKKHHSTVKDACELAQRLGVKNLLLYHTEEKNLADRKALYAEEGARYYTGHLVIPDDLEVVEL